MDVPSGEKKTLIMESAFDSMTYLTNSLIMAIVIQNIAISDVTICK